ncbi:hypothetical protein EON67_01330 [archaeon]|nr:MAG: hypothetical protein EON67_01330 [archaeon]
MHARALHERGLLYALPSCASSLAAPPAASPTQRVRYLRTSAVCSSVASALDVAHTATPSGGTYAVHLPDASKATLQYKCVSA